MRTLKNFGKLVLIAPLCLVTVACNTNTKGKSGAKDADSLIVAATAEDVKTQWKDSDVASIAFVGYYTDIDKAQSVAKNMYGFDSRSVMMEGDECYLIIPREPEAVIEIRPYSYDITKDKTIVGDPLYIADEAPVLLRCNLSDAISNARVTVTLADKTATLEPRLSLMDGTIEIPGTAGAGEGTILDITHYTQLMGEANEVSITYNCDPMKETHSLAMLKNGCVSVCANTESDYSYHEVEELDGTCKQIFWGNWGQAINPLLCMLMEDGYVEILDMNTALRLNDFKTSGRLPGLKNIVSFKHLDSDDATGVVAIDKDGKEHEVEVFSGIADQIYHYETTDEGNFKFSLLLTPDWKMFYGATPDILYNGRFSGKSYFESGETETYSYILYPGNLDRKSEIDVVPSEKGKFTLKMVENEGMGIGYEVFAKSGNIKFGCNSGASLYNYNEESPF